VTKTPDERPLLARAAETASTVVTICIEMVAPALLGYWVDRRLGTTPAFVIVGGILGMAFGLWSLIRLTNPMRRPDGGRPGNAPRSSDD